MKKEFEKEMRSKNLSRRNFLGTMGVATAALTIVPSYVLAGREPLSQATWLMLQASELELGAHKSFRA